MKQRVCSSLKSVRNRIKRERIHRSRRKTLNFGMLYGGTPKLPVPEYEMRVVADMLTRQFPLVGDVHSVIGLAMTGWDKDMHSFKNTPIRTGKIKFAKHSRTGRLERNSSWPY